MILKYVEDIRSSLKNKCYFAALSLSLDLPDICGYAEYPDKTKEDRFIAWYDEYIGKYLSKETEYDGTHDPWMSGRIVYELKEAFLYGDQSDTKETSERLNKFVLILGDGTTLTHLTFNAGVPEKGSYYKMMAIDVTYLCDMICNCAEWYYDANKDKFKEGYTTVDQKDRDICLAMDNSEGKKGMFDLITDNGKMGLTDKD